MPLRPNFLERTAFFSLNAAPGMMLDLAGVMATQTASLAMELGLFEVVAKNSLTVDEIARQLVAQERGIMALCHALVALGYLQETNGRYSNSKMTQRWILGQEGFDFAAMLTFWEAVGRDLIPKAAEVIRSGERPYDFYAWTESHPDLSAAYQRTLAMSANTAGSDVVKKLQLPQGPTRLLDVGGGHGTYSILMCQKYPQLQATILDYYVGLETARKSIAETGLEEQITLQKEEMWEADWGSGFDMILLFNVLHQYNLETNVQLLKKAYGALKPGGTIAVLDQITGKIPGRATNALIRLIALQYYLFADGRIFSRDDMNEIVSRAGFTKVQFHNLRKLPGNTLLTAVRGEKLS